ncbi:MAG TPA: DoxX family protein [Chitinophagaceae bacterium]|nr:DoxX family protein [Chitinophagaceae bacterium]
MKISVTLIRILTGVLFIFSGLVKANDPLGLSYKMQEFFEVWGVHGFNSWTLLMSVLMNAFEIIAGFALLLGWRIKLFGWLLLTLIVFFTFLTGYTYITGTPKNCGCFGDCLPITSKVSFLKDVALTLMILFLVWKQKYIRPLFSEKITTIAMLGITILSFLFQWYTLTYLPVIDCLPFKKGNSISEKMKMPANAVPDSTVITFIYKKGGKEVEFTADKFPADFSATTYEFVKRYDKIIRKGKNNEPPIKGFALSGDSNVDSTQFVLAQPSAILLFIEKFSEAGTGWKNKFSDIYAAAKAKNIPSYIITAEPGDAHSAVNGTAFADVQVFKCDFKAIETAARSNPCIYYLQKGIVMNKYSGKTMQRIKADIQRAPKMENIPSIQVSDSLNQ